MVSSTGLPCGTMIQMALRPFRFFAMSSSDRHAHIARRRQLLHRFRAEVEAHHLVAAQPQPLGHVAAHLAQTNQSQLHNALPSNLVTKLPSLLDRGAKHPRR